LLPSYKQTSIEYMHMPAFELLFRPLGSVKPSDGRVILV
jgi:hypothetical protein